MHTGDLARSPRPALKADAPEVSRAGSLLGEHLDGLHPAGEGEQVPAPQSDPSVSLPVNPGAGCRRQLGRAKSFSGCLLTLCANEVSM